jgi:ribosome-associated protein
LSAHDHTEASALAARVVGILNDGKAENVIEIDLRGKTDMAEAMVIASATSSRHAVSLAENVVRQLKQEGAPAPAVEGMRTGDWVLLDLGNVIVHVFRREAREYYKLERMWGSPVVPDAVGTDAAPRKTADALPA